MNLGVRSRFWRVYWIHVQFSLVSCTLFVIWLSNYGIGVRNPGIEF